MRKLQERKHAPPRRRHDAFRVCLCARRVAVAAEIFASGEGCGDGVRGEEIGAGALLGGEGWVLVDFFFRGEGWDWDYLAPERGEFLINDIGAWPYVTRAYGYGVDSPFPLLPAPL